jgi:hypothetical protein
MVEYDRSIATDTSRRQRLVPSRVTVVPPTVEIVEGTAELIMPLSCSSEKEAARPVKT